jgi:hypothetical protein
MMTFMLAQGETPEVLIAAAGRELTASTPEECDP